MGERSELAPVPDCGINFNGDLDCRVVLKNTRIPDRWRLTYRSRVSGETKTITVKKGEFDAPAQVRLLNFRREECLTGEIPESVMRPERQYPD